MVSTCGEINKPARAEALTFHLQRKRHTQSSFKMQQSRSLNELCKVGQFTSGKVAEIIIFTFTEVFLYSDTFHAGNSPSTVETVQKSSAKIGSRQVKPATISCISNMEPLQQLLERLLEDRRRMEGGGALYLWVKVSLPFKNDHWSWRLALQKSPKMFGDLWSICPEWSSLVDAALQLLPPAASSTVPSELDLKSVAVKLDSRRRASSKQRLWACFTLTLWNSLMKTSSTADMCGLIVHERQQMKDSAEDI